MDEPSTIEVTDFVRKLDAFKAQAESCVLSIVSALLEDEEPEEDVGISPEELVRSTGIGFSDDEFIFEEHQSRFGSYGTGYWTTYVKWKKMLRQGQPIYLGTIRQVTRPYSNPYSAVPHEGEWYIDSVPTVTRERHPRGVRWKLWAQQKFATRGGYGAVRFKHIPKTFPEGQYFKTRALAAGYLASLIKPHRHLKVVEDSSAFKTVALLLEP